MVKFLHVSKKVYGYNTIEYCGCSFEADAWYIIKYISSCLLRGVYSM